MDKKAVLVVSVCLLLAIGSFFFVGNMASNPDNYQNTMKSLEEKQTNVLKLTALTTASSTAVSMLPGDAATPIANKLADLTTYFLVILCAVILEKYLLTITGLAAFKLLIPAGLLLLAVWVFWQKEFLAKIAVKLIVFGFCLYVAIPSSVYVSNMLEETYNASLEVIMDDAESVNTEIESAAGSAEETEEKKNVEESKEDNTETSWWSSVVDSGKEMLDSAKDSVEEAVGTITSFGKEKLTELTDKAEKTLNNFIEATAVMLITSCVLPILVFLFYFWLMKAILGLDIDFSKMRSK